MLLGKTPIRAPETMSLTFSKYTVLYLTSSTMVIYLNILMHLSVMMSNKWIKYG